MSQSFICRVLAIRVLLLAATSNASAAVTITSGSVDVRATAVSGRLGSSSGVMQQDPPPLLGTVGLLNTTAGVVAGPVAPGEIPSLPGTAGVVTVNAEAWIEYIRTGGELVIDASAAESSSFVNMDGGSYVGSGLAIFSTEFTVSADTPYSLTGTAAFDDEDPTAFFRLAGGTLGNIVAILGASGNGPIASAGTLPPGDYIFERWTSINEVPIGLATFAESGAVSGTLVLDSNPPFDADDLNCDGAVTVSDIGAFVLAITNPAQYSLSFPSCDIDLADVNHDGAVTVSDIGPFVALLTG